MLCVSVGCLKALEEIENDTVVLLLLLFSHPRGCSALHKAASPAAAVCSVESSTTLNHLHMCLVPAEVRRGH